MADKLTTWASLVLVVAAVTSAEAQVGRSAMTRPTRNVLNQYGLERLWWNQATMDPSRETVEYLTADEELTYVQSSGGMITAFDNQSGRRLWTLLLGRGDERNFRVASNARTAFVVSGLKLYALDKRTGEQIWEIRLPSAPATGAGIGEDRAFVGALNGRVYGINLKPVRQLYREGILSQRRHEVITWEYSAGNRVTTTPVVSGNVVTFASSDGLLHGVHTGRSQLRFQSESDGDVTAQPTLADGALYVARDLPDAKVRSIRPERGGRQVWEQPVGETVRKPPRKVGNQVFVCTPVGGMMALDTQTGNVQWRQPRIRQFVAATPSRVYGSDDVSNLVILSRQDGSVQGVLPLRQYSVRVSNDLTDRLILATSRGSVVCLRERGRELPIYHKHPERRPLLPEFVDEESETTNSGTSAENP